MDLHSENVQTGLPRPDADAGIEPATTENIDFDYEILDVESQILDVAATLAIQTGGITSSRNSARNNQPASQPATIRETNALASDPVPPSIIACAKRPRRPTLLSRAGATASAAAAPGAAEPNVPPLPPCTFAADGRGKSSEPQATRLWEFLVTACKTRLDVYKSRTNTIKKLPMLQHFQTHTGVVPSTSKSYLIGNNRKFTWNQVFSAAGLQNATSPPLHTINCRSTQYSSLVGGDGDGDGDGESRSDVGGGDGGDEGGPLPPAAAAGDAGLATRRLGPAAGDVTAGEESAPAALVVRRPGCPRTSGGEAMCLCCKRPAAACPQSGPRPGCANLPQVRAEVAPPSSATGADWGRQAAQPAAGGGPRCCGGG